MLKGLIRLIFSSLLLQGCAGNAVKNGYLKLEFVKDKYLLRKQDQINYVSLPLLVVENDSLLLISGDLEKGILYRYDFNSGELLSELNVSEKSDFKALCQTKKRKFAFPTYDYINKDSVFLFLNQGYFHFKDKIDSTLMLTDWNGKIKQIYPLDSLPTNRYALPKIPLEAVHGVISNSGSKSYLDIKGQKIFYFTFRRWINTAPGDSLFEAHRTLMGGHLNLTDGKNEFVPHKIYQPSTRHLFGKGYYPITWAWPKTASTPHGILYSLGYSGEVWLYDPIVEKVIRNGRMASALIDSVPTSKQEVPLNTRMPYIKNYPTKDPLLPQYLTVHYDPYRHWYWRLVQQAPRPGATPLELNSPQYTFIVADTNFKVLAEGILPSKFFRYLHFFPIFRPEGVYFSDTEKAEAFDDKIVLSLFNPVIEKDNDAKKLKIALSQERKKLQTAVEPGLEKYALKKWGLKPNAHEAFLFVPVENSCGPCIDKVCAYFRDSSNYLSRYPIRLVLIGSNNATTQAVVQKLSLNTLPATQLLIDPKNEALKYAPQWINPRWVVFENGKITKDQKLNPDQIPQFPEYVKEFVRKR